jgi:hypothetical protein
LLITIVNFQLVKRLRVDRDENKIMKLSVS